MTPADLTALIDDLESRMRALNPDWDVPSLQMSYVTAGVYAALRDLYDAA